MDAPRVLRKVGGDFVVEVKVDGTFNPSDQSTAERHVGYDGAGLVVLADDKNYVRIERATLHFQGKNPRPYTAFEIRADGDVVRLGDLLDFPTVAGKPTWLRLERKGHVMAGAMSQDGVHWKYGTPKKLETKAWDGDEVRVGVLAVTTCPEPFAPNLSDYSLQKTPEATAGAPADGAKKPAPPMTSGS
jgi:regulation of enolase protein 1 (concanavalin A-like superfamily)